MTNAANQIWTTLEELQSGTIKVQKFRLLKKHQENFIKIIKIMAKRDEKEATFNEHSILQLMNIRDKEIHHFEKTVSDIRCFVEACQDFPGKRNHMS